MQCPCKLGLGKTGFMTSRCHFIRCNLHCTGCFARFHFIDRLQEFLAKLFTGHGFLSGYLKLPSG